MPQPYNIHLSHYEKAILGCTHLPREFCSLLAGVCRVSRLSRSYPNKHTQTIWDTSTNIIGPTLFFFVWWVLTEAKKYNVHRLYFLARDGQILMKIAQVIQRQSLLGIDCRYLYGSRQTWLIPSIKNIDRSDLDWIMSDWWYDISVASVCHRLGVSPVEIIQFLKECSFHKESFSKKLNAQEKCRLGQCLQSKDFQEWFQQRSKVDFENTFGYFKQERILDTTVYGFVDIGWRGNQQYSLHKILEKAGLPAKGIFGFYLGLTEALKKYPQDHVHSFLFDLSSSARRIYLRNNHLYEAFASSTQGKIIKFGQNNGQYYPIFANAVNQVVIDWGIEVQHAGILKFSAELLTHCPTKFFTEKNYYPVLEKILYTFIDRPSKDEAVTYGAFPMDGEMTESNIREIAPVVSRGRFWKHCLNLKSFDLFWVQATFIRSGLKWEYYCWKIILPLLARAYYLASKLFLRPGE